MSSGVVWSRSSSTSFSAFALNKPSCFSSRWRRRSSSSAKCSPGVDCPDVPDVPDVSDVSDVAGGAGEVGGGAAFVAEFMTPAC